MVFICFVLSQKRQHILWDGGGLGSSRGRGFCLLHWEFSSWNQAQSSTQWIVTRKGSLAWSPHFIWTWEDNYFQRQSPFIAMLIRRELTFEHCLRIIYGGRVGGNRTTSCKASYVQDSYIKLSARALTNHIHDSQIPKREHGCCEMKSKISFL